MNGQPMNKDGINRRQLFGAVAGTAVWTCWSAKEVYSKPMSTWETELIPNQPSANEPPIRILLNENPLGCSPMARAAAQAAVANAQYYPFDKAAKLANQLRRKHGMNLVPEPVGLSSKLPASDDSHVLSLAGGSSELLFAIAHAFTGNGGGIVEADPSYQALGAFALKRPHSSAYIKRVPILENGEADLGRMLESIDSDTKVVVINNPNNPTGAASRHTELLDFLKRVPDRVLTVVDEAYIEFLDDPENRSMIPLALQSSNIIVTRTFSKIHGLAGLRIGYAVGPRLLMEQIQNFRVGSFSLNQCGIAAAAAALEDTEFQAKSRAVARESRTRIMECLREHHFKVARSDAACVWAEGDSEVMPLVSKLADRGILIASGLRWDRPKCLRISIATSEQTTNLIDAIHAILKA